MAHPSNAFPKEFYLVNGAKTVTGDFYAIQVLVAANSVMTVKGSGIFDPLAQNAAGANQYIDPATGGSLTENSHAAGQYERLSTYSGTVPCVVGTTIYGSFNSVTGTAGDQFVVYSK